GSCEEPLFVTEDELKVEFRYLQKLRYPDLAQELWVELFALWFDHYRSRREVERSALRACMAEVWEERGKLFAERAALPPPQRAAGDERIAGLAQEIAGINTPRRPAPPSASWA